MAGAGRRADDSLSPGSAIAIIAMAQLTNQGVDVNADLIERSLEAVAQQDQGGVQPEDAEVHETPPLRLPAQTRCPDAMNLDPLPRLTHRVAVLEH